MLEQTVNQVGGRLAKAHAERDQAPRDEKVVRALAMVAVRSDELKAALDYLSEARVNSAGEKVDAQKAGRENFQDLLWAMMTTKEFLFNH